MNTLRKSERIYRKLVIDKLFTGNYSSSFTVFPLRVVYMITDDLKEPVSILISVSKKRFKRAVKRNRVKRQIRETYRIHKQELIQFMNEKNQHIAIAFIYLSNELTDSTELDKKMKLMLSRIQENLS